ncbi:MAG: barstar family protein [Saprospiraceae bacterium]|nr:barstar family protein [Saprospiraceae bacterium]
MSNFKILKAPYDHQKKRDSDTIIAFIECGEAATVNDFYSQIQKGLKLPAYFGKNLDALYDCLCDFSWLDAREVHIILRNYDVFLAKEPKNKRWDILAVLNDAAAEWKAMKGKDKIKLEIYVEPSQRIKQDLEDAEA